MAIHLVRHAKAGSRPDWHQPDELRPLTNAGLVQATAIADALLAGGHDIRRILSSRFVRCVQTVQPLADKLGLEIEQHRALAEEAAFDDTWALVRECRAAAGDTVLASHGNVIPPILDRLHRRGIALVGDDWSCHKGSVWTIELEPGTTEIARAVQTLARA